MTDTLTIPAKYFWAEMNDLKNSIKNRNTVLFIGGGISMNLGLPSWSQLIDKMAEDLGIDRREFHSYGTFFELAEFYILKKGIGSLRSWMDREWHRNSVKIEESKIHRLIVELDFPIIYTTNYDRWIEITFEHYKKPYIKISDLSNLTESFGEKTQIVKFHGDFDNDDSIVLSESNYFERLNFETPLDIKLRADILGKSILFIGYSLTDINIRFLLYKLNKLWEHSGVNIRKPKSFIFLALPNPVQEVILERRGIIPIFNNHQNIEYGLTAFLESLKS